MASPALIRVLSPLFCSGNAISGCVLHLSEAAQSSELRVECWLPGTRATLRRTFMRTPFPHHVTRVMYRLGFEHLLQRRLEHGFRKAAREPGIAWIWPGTSVEIVEQLAQDGHTIVLERVNSSQEHARAILLDAHERLGLRPGDGPALAITDDSIAVERRKLELAHHVFSPSPVATDSFRRAGVAPEKILATSYGWDPGSFGVRGAQRRHDRQPPTFLFVGSGDVRKGLPWLLRYWERAAVDGRLVITGTLDPRVEKLCAAQLERDDVLHIPFTDNLVPLYESADVFVLPSLEEGSPLVGYLALAAGLPCLVGPAAASGVVRHDVEGLVHDPLDEAAWVASLRLLARDHGLRAELGKQALRRAAHFTWAEVGKRRRAQLEGVLGRTEVPVPVAEPTRIG